MVPRTSCGTSSFLCTDAGQEFYHKLKAQCLYKLRAQEAGRISSAFVGAGNAVVTPSIFRRRLAPLFESIRRCARSAADVETQRPSADVPPSSWMIRVWLLLRHRREGDMNTIVLLLLLLLLLLLTRSRAGGDV